MLNPHPAHSSKTKCAGDEPRILLDNYASKQSTIPIRQPITQVSYHPFGTEAFFTSLGMKFSILNYFSIRKWYRIINIIYFLLVERLQSRYVGKVILFPTNYSVEYKNQTRSSTTNLCCAGVQQESFLSQLIRLVTKRHLAQIPQCISPISHNIPFCNRNVHICAHFCYKMVHCWIFIWCIVGFVRYIYCYLAAVLK